MYVDFDILNEEARAWLHVFDPNTDTNFAAGVRGTPTEIYRLGLKSAHFMDGAGFVAGWCPKAKHFKSIDYLILVREAVERCWWESFKK
jgi:hypothetical protein